MDQVRIVVAQALALRSQAKIKVRQPLNSLKISGYNLSADELEIIKDELNVNRIILSKGDNQVELDTDITRELALEGKIREAIRLIQSARKKIGCGFEEEIKAQIALEDGDGKLKKYLPRIEQATSSKIVDEIKDPEASLQEDGVAVFVSR